MKKKINFKKLIIPKRNLRNIDLPPDTEVIGVSTVYEAFKAAGLIGKKN